MISTDLPKPEMIHYRFSHPMDNGKKGQDSTQLTVTAAFGSKQITFVRSEARACTVSANNVHIGWNAYDRISGVVPPATVRSGYEEGQRLDTYVPGMGAHSEHQRRHIPMATVPKNGLICLTSFTDEKFPVPGMQRASQTTTTEVFKTRPPAAANTGINPCRSTSCHLVRDRFRRDLKKGQKILWANERLDNLHAQITKQVGGGTRQLQEGILDYVDKISTCFMKKNSHSFGQPSSVLGSYPIQLGEERQKREEKEVQEARNNSPGDVKEKKNAKNETGNQVKEKTPERSLEKRREEKEVRKTKKKEEQLETKEAERGKRERLERGKTDGEVINNSTKTELVSPRYQHQKSLQSQQASRQRKDNESIQAQTADEEIRTDFQYRIDSNLTVACAKSSPNPNHESYSTTYSSHAQVGTPKFAMRRRTCPNINFNIPSSILPDT